MTNNIDWSRAPEGVTHCLYDDGENRVDCWYLDDGKAFVKYFDTDIKD